MSFASPLALALGLLALPVVVLYILKIKRRRVGVPYLRLWAELVVETRARSLIRRLKRFYSLLLQLLILGSLVLAMAEPGLELGSVKKESIVLLLDVSASMRAREADGRERIEWMLDRARELVGGRSWEDEMLLAAVSDRVDVLASFTRNRLRLENALERVRPTFRSLDVERALDFARAITADRENSLVLFLGDGAAGDVARAIEGKPSEYLLPVGEAAENVGILRLAARKNASLGTDHVLAVVKNFGAEPAECTLDFQLDGQSKKVLARTIPAGEEIVERLALELPQGGVLSLDTGHPDALACDDSAWAVVRPGRLRRVVLVAPDKDSAIPFWIAFQSMGELIDESSVSVTAEEYALLSAEDRQADVTICLSVLPEGLPERGNLILLDTPIPAFLPLQESGRDEHPSVWDWDRDHVLNFLLNWRDLPLPTARKLLVDGGQAIVESYDGPLVAAFEGDARMSVYVGFDMTAELFPFRLAFPIFLRNAIAWFEVEEDLLFEDSYAPGEVIQPLRRVSGEHVDLTFLDAAGETVQQELEVRDGRFAFSGTDALGVYLFRISSENHATCVNLFTPQESAIAPTDRPAGQAELAIERGSHLFNRDLWVILALVGLVLWALEWASYHRRITE